MLTNNKKSYFVKSIAMIMAVLMVLAVCLTGCGNKAAEEAAQKAENAQNTATEAKTAADAVKAALAEYLKTADAVTIAAVNAEIDKALAGYAKTADLADFVKSGALKDLSDKLDAHIKGALTEAKVKEIIGAYVTPTQLTEVENALKALITKAEGKADTVKAEITATLANYVTSTKLAEATEALTKQINDVNTKVDNLGIDKKINDALVAYATKAEVDALGGRLDKLENVVRAILEAFYTEKELADLEAAGMTDLLNLPAETIATLIKDKMSLTEWNETTPVVIETIDSIQTLLSKIYNDTQSGLRDAYTKAAKDQINEYLKPLNIVMFDSNYNVTAYNKNAKHLEYTILRVATIKELNELKAAIDNANAVKNFKEELADLNNGLLFTIGDEHKATDPKDLMVQTVTISNKAEINAYVEAYDALIIKYITDEAGNAFNNTIYANTYGKQPIMNVWQHPTTGKLVVVDTAATKYETTENGKTVAWNKTTNVTILTQNVALDANGVVSATDLVNGDEWKKADSYELIYLPTTIAEFDWANGQTTFAKVDGHYGSNKDLEVAATFKNPEGTLLAVVRQTQDAQDLVNTANKTFADFLANVVKAYGYIKVDGKDVALAGKTPTDPQYLEALTVGMCTPVQGDPAYFSYLLIEVQADMNAAMARNTCVDANNVRNGHTDEIKTAITKYDLYFDMSEKAWGLAFELYRTYAKEMLTGILADYVSIVDNYKFETSMPGKNDTALVEANGFRAQYGPKELLNPDFIDAFLNGKKEVVWTSYTTGKYAAIEVKKSFATTALVNYYGELNGLAETSKGVEVVADPAATIAANEMVLRMYLTSSVQYISRELADPNLADEAKAEFGINVAGIFNKMLKQAVANLDEVYNRFLFEDYKADKINETYDYAKQMVAIYSGNTDDFANFDAAATDKALIEALEHYLTGYSVTAATAPAKDVTTNKLFPEETALVNASLVNEFKTVVVNPFEIIDQNANPAMIGTEAMAVIADKVDAYEVTLENVAIKDNFLSYLNTATINVANAHADYWFIDGLTYDMLNALITERNMADTAITITKFQFQMGGFALDEFITQYTNLLKLIAGKEQELHLKRLTGKTFAKALDEVKSSTTPGYGYVTAPVQPIDYFGTKTVAYNFVGSAVVSFDEVVNVNTQYFTNDKKTETDYLYTK